MRRLTLTVGVAALLLLAGCGDTSSTTTAADPAPSETTTITPLWRYAVATDPDTSIDVRPEPDAATEPVFTLPGQTMYGTPTVARVLEYTGVRGWARIEAPGRPPARIGWVPAATVDVHAVDPDRNQILIDTAAREITITIDGAAASFPAGVGSAENPTPVGNWWVTDLVETGDPGGAYGAYAVGLSARSETITEFGDGDGQIGIHGTNEPDSVGQAVSHGCVRVPAEAVELLREVFLGMPVVVVARG
jgi:lipoprotein-anchoring transpeptidase ErfK/SrfK